MSRFLEWRNGANTGCVAPLPRLMNHQYCPMAHVAPLLLLQLLFPLSKPGFTSMFVPPETPRKVSSR